MAASSKKTPRSNSLRKRLMVTTAIVGGGATGGGVLKHLVQEYLDYVQSNPRNTPDLTVHFYEAHGQYGFGGPYNYEPPVFRLNQPAGRMSIDRHNPGAFIAWFNDWQRNQPLEKTAAARALYDRKKKSGMSDSQFALKYPSEYIVARRWRENDFLPRSFFGVYLRHEFKKTLELADTINAELGHKAINIIQHNAAVDKLSSKVDGFVLQGTEIEEFNHPFHTQVDTAVIATGHHKNDFLSEYRDHPDYLDTPMTIDLVVKRLSSAKDPARPIVIAGTGQSMLDALAAIDAVGYKGKIIAISPGAVEPWPYETDKEAFPRNDYPLKYVTKEEITSISAMNLGLEASVANFRTLLVKELHSPEAIAAGPGHVFTTLRHMEDELRTACIPCEGLFERARSMIEEFSINHTFSERFSLFQKYKSEGRLEVRSGRITGAAADLPNGFEVHVVDTVSEKEETIAAVKLINCASMLRTPYYIDPETKTAHSADLVIESALRDDILTVDTKTKTINPASKYSDGTIEIVGPAHGGAWGIPYTRDAFEAAAKSILKKTLKKKTSVQRKLKSNPKPRHH